MIQSTVTIEVNTQQTHDLQGFTGGSPEAFGLCVVQATSQEFVDGWDVMKRKKVQQLDSSWDH